MCEVWSISWKTWDVDDKTENVINEVTVYAGDGTYFLAEHEVILMQYIGKKDKNGWKIFEGDITLDGEVVFCDYLSWDSGGSEHPGFYFRPLWQNEFNGDLRYHTAFNSDTQVIGNKYENPELLVWKS